MAKVRLTADVEPELMRQVKIAAASEDKSVSQWVEDALQRELDGDARYEKGITWPALGVQPRGSLNPPKLRGGGSMSDAVIEDREDRDRLLSGAEIEDWNTGDKSVPLGIHPAPKGSKPKGSEKPPRLRDGSTIAEVVIEDRR